MKQHVTSFDYFVQTEIKKVVAAERHGAYKFNSKHFSTIPLTGTKSDRAIRGRSKLLSVVHRRLCWIAIY
jgi:hypothetical protein